MKKITEEKLVKIIKQFGINKKIISTASKMDINIVKLINDKILCCSDDKIENNVDIISTTLLGVYGNYIATTYYQSLGYKVTNEFPVLDDDNNLLTKADIAFYDKSNKLNLCEVKMSHQILDNIRNYVDDEDREKGSYTDKDKEIIKYKSIGKKLMEQVNKLTNTNCNVNVITFNGCYLDDIILSKLEEKKVNHKVLSVDINTLENEIKNTIYNIYNYCNIDTKTHTV